MKRLICLPLLLLLATPGHALITSASGQSTPASVSATAPGSVRLSWQIISTQHNAPVHSTQLGFALDSCNHPDLSLNRSLGGTLNGAGTLRLTETVPVPPGLTARARRSGRPNILLCRTFSDADGTATAIIQLPVHGSGLTGRQLGLEAITLRLNNGETGAVVPRGAPLAARALMRYRGHGLLEGVWEIAGPMTSDQRPGWRTLAPIHRMLGAGGTVQLVSPDLPTATPGVYQLRLRLIRPPVQSDTLMLRYQVTNAHTLLDGVRPIALSAPDEGARLRPNTRFRWQCLPGAHHYLLLLQAEDDQPPLGQAVRPACSAEQMDTTLSEGVWSRLRPHESWHWWVEAIDAHGRPIGRTPKRKGTLEP